MRRNRPKPVKKAFDLVDRLDPSILKRPCMRKSCEVVYSSIAVLRSPSSSGSNLLNSGMMSTGARKRTKSWNTVTTIQQ